MISNHIDQLLAFFAQAGPWLYVIAFAAAVIEGAAFAGLVFPSETILLIAGATTIHGAVHLSILIPTAVVGAVLGDSVGYAVGRRMGSTLRTSRMGRRVSDSSWQRAEELIHQRGWLAVMIGRFISVLRALVPAMAGTLHMRYRKFLMGNVLGAALWTPLVLLVGHFAAHHLRGVEKLISRSGWTLFAFFALVVTTLVLPLRRDRSRNRVG